MNKLLLLSSCATTMGMAACSGQARGASAETQYYLYPC